MALILLEITDVRLSVRPHINAIAALFAVLELSKVEPAVGPLEQALTVHHIVVEGTLVDFSAARNTSTPTINLAVRETAFEYT